MYLYENNNCIEAYGYQDGAKPNTHHWNFGNGKTSNEMNPEICYEKEGTYTVTHSYKDSTNNNITQTQDVVVIYQVENATVVPVKIKLIITYVYFLIQQIILFL